jgi:hypothetical protein
MSRTWVENILKICRQENVDFFFKQWGGVRKASAGRLLHNRTYDEMPGRCVSPVPSKETRFLMAKAHSARILMWQGTVSGRQDFVAAKSIGLPSAPHESANACPE